MDKKRAAGNPLTAGGSQGPLLLPKAEDISNLHHDFSECNFAAISCDCRKFTAFAEIFVGVKSSTAFAAARLWRQRRTIPIAELALQFVPGQRSAGDAEEVLGQDGDRRPRCLDPMNFHLKAAQPIGNVKSNAHRSRRERL